MSYLKGRFGALKVCKRGSAH